jgi:hypothetical protein
MPEATFYGLAHETGNRDATPTPLTIESIGYAVR